MDSFESKMNPRFLAESEKGMLWEPRVIKSGRGTVEGFKEDEMGKRRASVLSSALGGTFLHKQDSCNNFIGSWWDCPAQTGQLQYTSSGLGGTRFVTVHGIPPHPPIECLGTLKSLLLTYYLSEYSIPLALPYTWLLVILHTHTHTFRLQVSK